MDLSPDEDNFQGRLLHQAALWDNVELLQELIASGAEVDGRDANGRSALHAAALCERSRCLPVLCAAGAQLDVQSDHRTGGKTALHLAAERGHVENVRVLVGAGADLAARDAADLTALALAEARSHRHAAQALRDARDSLERERLSQHAQLRELVTRGEAQQLRTKLGTLGTAAGLIVNLTPGGANTLLYVASEGGLTPTVSALLDAGADGRAHPVTKYSPLYIACYHGHADIVRLLLGCFPEAVQQETVEKWLPIHAACIGGHAALVTLLLEYPYPESVLKTYSEASGQWQYKAAFDVNACDVSGQTALYVACTLGNLALVEALLAHTVPCLPLDQSAPPEPPPPVVSPQRGISLGIHAIVSKLTGNATNHAARAPGRECRAVRPDARCAGDSCVAVCARMGHTRVLQRLLAAGADPNAPALPPTDTMSDVSEGIRESRRRSRSAGPGVRHAPSPSPATRNGYDADRSGGWTALAVAARARNVQVAEMLLAHGAQDPQCRALRECARHSLTDLVDKLLATKAYPDPEYKLNKSTMAESVFTGHEGDSQLTYSALCPSTAVMLNWRELRCQLAFIRPSWMVSAALRVNSKLSCGGSQALQAITRVDVSNNDLRLLPHQLFSMLSLRYLNAAQNKLERLPTASDVEDEPRRRGRRPRPRPQLYTAPLLQEIYLQDNRLEELPAGLFSLPALTSLDVSNNKLRALPPSLWAAPALRDLNAALNHLKDLPRGDQMSPDTGQSQESPTDSTSQMSASPTNGGLFGFSSSTSRSPSIERGECGEWDDEDGVLLLGNRAGNAVCSEARRVGAWRGAVGAAGGAGAAGGPGGLGGPGGGCPLQGLNLAHNQFTCVPPPLACRAPCLTRLNMAYNSLRSMSYVTSYPSTLRQLDLSHNEITCWPSLPQVESFGASEGDPLACYCPVLGPPRAPAGPPRAPAGPPRAPRPRSGGSVRAQLLSAACPARRHLRLEALRTLILANNLLTRIQLTTDDDGLDSQDQPTNEQDEDWTTSAKGRLVFPWLSMLDVSCNLLRAVPPAIHLLNNLSVLNISGNKDITELPPQMGLLSRLWNLNTVGCSLVEPLRSMMASGRYKSMDIVGYLKSVLQEARPYSTMKLMIVGLQGIGKTSLLECLRQESGIQHRRKPTDHWAKRMGNKSSRRGNMSTVGVDIGSWVYDKARSSRGPVTFRTWDFGGQQEYYATHQYFLSRRSLYLVLWRATDGRQGLAGALHWLRSIQARAPGSPVIMVATHYDQVANCSLPESESPESLQRLIRSAIMAAPDADKLGLPRVMDTLEVSCSTRHNIRLLADIIYSVAYSVKPPGSKEPLLEQRVPATYLALEECVTTLAADLKEPVLRHDEYRKLVSQYMQQKNHRMFRDAAELHQATMFLHDNGVLLHYDDATLKELYFLRPQWLCDVLAHVVTVREINPFANQGIMKVEDLAHVFKASPQLSRGEEAGALGVSLLNKFELALCWDARVLLVPPLLPDTEPALPQLPVRSRAWSGPGRAPRRAWGGPGVAGAPGIPRPATPRAADVPRGPDTPRATDSPTLIQEASCSVSISGRSGSVGALRRLLLVSYVPCGFWPRLVTRLLADAALNDAPHALYTLPTELEVDEVTAKAVELQWGWKLWKTGLRLVCGSLELASLSERPPLRDPLIDTRLHHQHDDHNYTRLRVRQDGSWCELNVQRSAIVQLELPALVCVVKRDDGLPLAGYQSISLEPNPEILAKVLAMISDHVDLLLEDWYPSLGTRFVHTSEGRCLITRVVPCPECLKDPAEADDPLPPTHDHLAQAFRRLDMGGAEPPRPRLSEESRTSDGDSGVGAESNASSRLGSVEGMVSVASSHVSFGWTVEECILAACTGKTLHCPHHGVQELRHIAPDTLLLDVEESRRARWEDIWRGPLAGRGAFGTVLEARWRPAGGPARPVALKALQPVQPPAPSDLPALQAYKAAMCRWEREPAGAACRAYLGLRQELSILRRVSHPHVVPLIAVCAAPLALLLQLAPMGALDGALRQYRGCGQRVPGRAARALALQVARALEYLHAARIVYRDLKSENVLVWRLPRPQDVSAAELSSSPIDVHVKLADYGISRLAPPSGTKGFGGTEGFMAPEIMRYNGEEEYNEKVDCFSYGMLLYEIVTTRQPFEGHEAVKEAVLEGARPTLTPRELEYPCCMLETMRRCWAGAPELRPSAAALVSVASAPEYTALMDACAARAAQAAGCLPVLTVPEEGAGGWEVWFGGGEPERVHTLLTTTAAFTHQYTIRIPPDHAQPVFVSAMCRVGAAMWLGDTAGRLSVYSAATCALCWSVGLHEAVGGAPAAVAALEPLPGLRRVALALATGRLFLVSSQRPEAEGSFVLTELGTATELCCLAVLPTAHGCEVWAGGGGLSSFVVRAGGVCSAEQRSAARVTQLAAAAHHGIVLAYTYPGVCITQWTAEGATGARLDVSKLVPCSETLQSIAIEQHLPQDKCRVTALCVLSNEVYVGTAWGCLVVADVATLRPITVFRPYEEDVRAIVPLLPPKGCGEAGPMLATFGSGYRPLLNRYAPPQSNTSTTHAGHHCLLWRAQHWLPD